jgi:hypothetical protein
MLVTTYQTTRCQNPGEKLQALSYKSNHSAPPLCPHYLSSLLVFLSGSFARKHMGHWWEGQKETDH